FLAAPQLRPVIVARVLVPHATLVLSGVWSCIGVYVPAEGSLNFRYGQQHVRSLLRKLPPKPTPLVDLGGAAEAIGGEMLQRLVDELRSLLPVLVSAGGNEDEGIKRWIVCLDNLANEFAQQTNWEVERGRWQYKL
ncbi:MAG: hypothetical protein ACKPKO_53685, partial [Candidatus Fonsibacter sp.]